MGFGSLRIQKGQFGLLDRTYSKSSECMLLFLVRMYARGSLYVRSGNSTRTNAILWYTLWLIPRRTKHPLDHCINSTGRMVRLANVRCFFRGLVEPLGYKYPYPFSFLMHSQAPRLRKSFLVCTL